VNVRESLRYGSRKLVEAGSEEASLEAELLLADALNTDRPHLYQRLHEALPSDAGRAFEALLQRRLAHEPTAYIIGRKEFYGLDLEVTPAAIIPRPETETLAELVLEFVTMREAGAEALVVDVGTGCGAIAVTLAVHLPRAEIIATDVSPEALALARRNAERHSVAGRIRFLEGDLLEPLDDVAHPEPKPGVSRDSSRRADVIAANLPYVRTGDFEAGPPEIRQHEPRLGLDGGPDGLRVIGRLLRQAPSRLRAGGALFVEIGEEQGEAARQLAADVFPRARVEVQKDLSGLDRVLAVRA
jgi:release factor glutamine methyltransferase